MQIAVAAPRVPACVRAAGRAQAASVPRATTPASTAGGYVLAGPLQAVANVPVLGTRGAGSSSLALGAAACGCSQPPTVPSAPQGICNNQGRCECGRCICDKASVYISSTCEISYSLVSLSLGTLGALTSPSHREPVGKESKARVEAFLGQEQSPEQGTGLPVLKWLGWVCGGTTLQPWACCAPRGITAPGCHTCAPCACTLVQGVHPGAGQSLSLGS